MTSLPPRRDVETRHEAAPGLRLAVFGSGGGSAFAAFHDLVTGVFPDTYSFVGVADRPCGFEVVCRERGIPWLRVEEKDTADLSRVAAEYVDRFQADVVLLYFLRLLTSDVYERFPTFNIHPALLPAFPGLDAVRRAFDAGTKFLGATLHQVDASLDGGQIVAQTVLPIPQNMTLDSLEHHSYIQKVYLSLVLLDLFSRGSIGIEGGRAVVTSEDGWSDRSNPSLARGPLLDAFLAFQLNEDAEVAR